jgi:hypothetical protein
MIKMSDLVSMIKMSDICQNDKTKVMHSLFSSIRIKGLYMFRSFLTHPQEVLNKQQLVYFMRVMSFDCYQDWSGTNARNIPTAAHVVPPKDEQVMLKNVEAFNSE